MKKIIVLVLLLCVAGFAHAELLINGDFETGDGWSGWGAWGSGSGAGGWMSFFGTIMPSGGSDGGQYLNLDATAGTSWVWLAAWNDGAYGVAATTGDAVTFDAQIRDTSGNSGILNVFFTFFDAADIKVDMDGDGCTTGGCDDSDPVEDRIRLEYASAGDSSWSPLSGIQAGAGSVYPAGDSGGDYGVYVIPTPLSGETIATFDWFFSVEGAVALDIDECSLDIDADLLPSNVYPTDGQEYVPTTAVLEWGPPSAFTPIAYDVYLSITDPNADKAGDKVVDHANQTTYDDPCDLEDNTKYYWRVNAYDPCDAIRKPGRVWSFTTLPIWPIFSTDAESATVEAGSSAQFYVQTPRSNTFQWYKEPSTAVNHGDDGGDVSVVTDPCSSTLTISNVELADEGYYYCEATGTGSTESNHARLLTRRLMGHWKFDAPLTNMLDDEVAGNDGTLVDPNVLNPPPGLPTGTSGIDGAAIKLETGQIYVEIPDQEYFNFFPQGCTVSCWAKASSENTDWQGLVSKMGGEALPPASWALEKGGATGYGWFANNEASGTTAINDGEWHHLALVYDADTDTLRLYVNGEVEGTATGVDLSSRTTTDAPLRIGTYDGAGEGEVPDGAPGAFYGSIDNVMIANYPWDGYQVATEYTQYAGGSICVEPVPGDLNDDCVINTGDAVIAALNWLKCNLIPVGACD